MGYTFEVDGEEYEVTGNPQLGTVRWVQPLDMRLMTEHLDEEALQKAEELDDDEWLEQILGDADIEVMMDLMWARSVQEPLATICLASNAQIDPDDFDKMYAEDFRDALEESKDALGGDAYDFIEGLGIDISSQMNKIQEEMESSDLDLPMQQSELSPSNKLLEETAPTSE